MQLVDIGANLTHSSFQPDIDLVLERARARGVAQIVVTGADAHGVTAAHALALAHPGRLFSTAGVHPHHAADFTGDTEDLLRDYLTRPEVVAVGETGLDYFRDLSPRDAQRFAF